MSPHTAPAEGLHVPARTLPFPSSISDAAQAALRRLVNADGVPVNALQVMSAPDDIDGWLRVKAGADAWYAAALAPVEATLRAACRTLVIGAASVHIATPADAAHTDAVLLELHGGGLVMGGGAACRIGARQHADQFGPRCVAVDYRLPPQHPYPAALDDCLQVYRHLLAQQPAHRIVICGRSAGGNLATAMLLRAR
ncbi:MAG: Monoterpene epsilon-lactone hydrolase [Stenotrophomonas maltophilia]|uniref:Monoterpene epsilon-lactone hydrolase n=1 Tax=Stenotrophomonas maltophilia TaxID=40324 RepID=A0A7V8JN91_STEMA|nr:MAG: Monoterpene epsilon-lactone hydrolase [Stenotrophomonas maltophilia]